MDYEGLAAPFEPNWPGLVDNILRRRTPDRTYFIELFHDGEVQGAIGGRFGLADGLDPDDPDFSRRRREDHRHLPRVHRADRPVRPREGPVGQRRHGLQDRHAHLARRHAPLRPAGAQAGGRDRPRRRQAHHRPLLRQEVSNPVTSGEVSNPVTSGLEPRLEPRPGSWSSRKTRPPSAGRCRRWRLTPSFACASVGRACGGQPSGTTSPRTWRPTSGCTSRRPRGKPPTPGGGGSGLGWAAPRPAPAGPFFLPVLAEVAWICLMPFNPPGR